MKEDIFFEMMADILDTDRALSMETALADIDEWNSLALLSFMADMEKHAVRKLDAKSVREADTLKDLYEMLKKDR